MKTTIIERFNNGDLARAYDLCLSELLKRPEDIWLRHRAVLCLIRSGALERAEEVYRRFGLAEYVRDEDCLALGARLDKARAFEADEAHFSDLAQKAAEKYEEVFESTGGHYPGINAATMFLLSGQVSKSKHLAQTVLTSCAQDHPKNAEAAYYQMASQAEAYLLLGDLGLSHISLRNAISQDKSNYLGHATTIRQLRTICDAKGFVAPWLVELEPPKPGHFAGHLFRLDNKGPSVSPDAETQLATSIMDTFERENLGVVYGAMAAGADILFGEAALRYGSELQVVLPVPANVFIASSVRPMGREWVKRCEVCLEGASVIHEVTSNRKIISDLLIRSSSEVAMGLARMRADVFATTPVQLLIWDGQDSQKTCGTVHDARIWKNAKLKQVILPFDSRSRYKVEPKDTEEKHHIGFEPQLRAMIFADISGSSKVADDKIPVFVEEVLGKLVETVKSMEVQPLQENSWGDGLFLTFQTVTDASKCAIALQRAFASLDMVALDLPEFLGLRIGGHYGPVFEAEDPLQKKLSLFGGQVAIAARIEPVTVPGSVFVSEAMAATLAMEAADSFRCEYIGQSRRETFLEDIALYSLRSVAPGSFASLARRTSARIPHLTHQPG